MKSITEGAPGRRAITALLCLFGISASASAATFSFSGTLSGPQDYVTYVLHLNLTGTVALQTYSFGGGTLKLGDIIPAGGFDPFVGIFAGTGPGATFIDGSSDILSNFIPGCPPAGLVTIGSVTNQCGDPRVTVGGLTPGDYTVLLSDAEYFPAAATESSPAFLGDGFTDFTGGSSTFQTCIDIKNCNVDTANWALNIFGPEGSSIVAPEPASLQLTAAGLIAAASVAFARRSRLRAAAIRRPTI